MNGFVSTLNSADGPWASDIAFSRDQRIILALSLGNADRMNRRQIQNVKAYPRNVTEPCGAIAKCSGPLCIFCARAQKHLIPRAKARLHWIYDNDQFSFIPRALAQIAVASGQLGKFSALCELDCGTGIRRQLPQSLHRVPQLSPVPPPGSIPGPLQQLDSAQHVHGDVDARLHSLSQVGGPGAVRIHPAADRVNVPPEFANLEFPRPAIILDEPHRCLLPVGIIGSPKKEPCSELIVAVRKNVRVHANAVTYASFNRK